MEVASGGGFGAELSVRLRAGADVGGRMGFSGAAGDFDGDGCADLLLAEPSVATGAVLLYPGSEAGLVASPGASMAGAERGDSFGRVVAVGDLDGDDRYDLASLGGQNYQQYVSVYLGAEAGPVSLRDMRREDAADFGEQLALGDVNGDGYDDLFVGSPNGSTSPTAELLGYFGSATGPSADPDWVGAWCGAWADGQISSCALAVAGDVDGDGFADLVVGHRSWENSAFPPRASNAQIRSLDHPVLVQREPDCG